MLGCTINKKAKPLSAYVDEFDFFMKFLHFALTTLFNICIYTKIWPPGWEYKRCVLSRVFHKGLFVVEICLRSAEWTFISQNPWE